MTGVITLGLLPNQSIELNGISASKPWNRTGLVLECTARYRFEVLHFDNWVDGSKSTDPNGYSSVGLLPWLPFRRVRLAKWMHLMGAVGTSGKSFFPIGLKTERQPNTAGEFYCFANDALFRYSRNNGELSLRVTRLK